VGDTLGGLGGRSPVARNGCEKNSCRNIICQRASIQPPPLSLAGGEVRVCKSGLEHLESGVNSKLDWDEERQLCRWEISFR